MDVATDTVLTQPKTLILNKDQSHRLLTIMNQLRHISSTLNTLMSDMDKIGQREKMLVLESSWEKIDKAYEEICLAKLKFTLRE